MCKVSSLKLRFNLSVIQQKVINKFYALERDKQALLILTGFNNGNVYGNPNSASG